MEEGGGLSGLHGKWSLALAVLLGLFFPRDLAPSQEVPPSITVTVNQSVVFGLTQKARRVSVTQPEIAEVVVISPNQLLINGKSIGATSLIVWDEKRQVTKFDLLVLPDIAALRRQLMALFPEEKVEVSTSGPAIVLKGEVSNEVVYDKVLEITQSYLPPKPKEEVAPPTSTQSVTITSGEPRLPTTGTAFAGGGQLAFIEERSPTDVARWANKRGIEGIIDLLVIKEVRQIQLDVIVAEVSLSKVRELGLDYLFNLPRGSSSELGFSRSGTQAGFPTGNLFGDPATFPTVQFGGGTSAIFRHIGDRFQIAAVARLFQNRDVTEILARPNLIIKNGRSGGFLAGGEFPLTVQNIGVGSTTTSIVFKPFGIRLDFLPTITWSNSIDLRVFPEVSDIDRSVTVLGVPGLRVRRSVSRVEMKEGETLVMSGLLDRRVLEDLTKFPLLGDIPVLGALFRSTRFRDQETELVFVITPKIVKALRAGEQPKIPSIENYKDPDMRQIPLPGGSSTTPDMPSGKTAEQGPTIP